jgi:hypothetical protein
MFHIVFDTAGAELLSTAMDMDESLDGEIVCLRDDYSIGPIGDLSTETGRHSRNAWLMDIREGEKDSGHPGITEESDQVVLDKILQRMRDEEFDQIWIWVAPNAKDVSGYYWLLSGLRDFYGRTHVISLNNLPFIGEKGNIFYPRSLSEIPSREFIKAKILVRPVTTAEFETDPDEWQRLASENKNLRVLEGGKKIVQHADDYYDNALLHFLPPVFQKIHRTVQQFNVKSPEKISESFLVWRLRFLISSGVAEQQGEMIRVFVKAADEINS